MRRGSVPAALVATAIALAGAARAAEGACQARGGRKGAARFVALCGSDLFLSAAPLACTPEELEAAACDPVTALEATPLPAPRKNAPVPARMVTGAEAARLCAERYGGRLPTPAERAAARRDFGLVSLQVREEPGEFARLRLDELPEWVAEGEHPARTPAAAERPRRPGESLLRCVAAPAMAGAAAVALGSVCDERPPEAGIRSPDCALAAPDERAKYELGCDPAYEAQSRATAELAAVRCVVPEQALDLVQPRGAQ